MDERPVGRISVKLGDVARALVRMQKGQYDLLKIVTVFPAICSSIKPLRSPGREVIFLTSLATDESSTEEAATFT